MQWTQGDGRHEKEIGAMLHGPFSNNPLTNLGKNCSCQFKGDRGRYGLAACASGIACFVQWVRPLPINWVGNPADTFAGEKS